jgi:hypothetical protein
MTVRTAGGLKVEREITHRLEGIPLGNSDEGIRVSDAKMSFDCIVKPGQAQYLQRALTMIDIHVTVEPTMQQDISGYCIGASRETRLGCATRQHDRGVPLPVTMARAVRISLQSFDTRRYRSKLMGWGHALSVSCPRLPQQQGGFLRHVRAFPNGAYPR